MEIKIMVATHKEYQMPDDSMYLPVFVGSIGKENICNYQRDDEGENISSKNPNYCELTALYWGWKNLDSDYIGLAHYRRHFITKKPLRKRNAVISMTELKELCSKTSIILPKARKYYIENNYSHYIHGHKEDALNKAISILEKNNPEYREACKTVMNRTWAHMFNMMIMEKTVFKSYCEWLFDILFKLEKILDISTYSPFEARVFGRISELFLDIWIEKNEISYVEIPVAFMEKQNWLHKGGMFLLRKFHIFRHNERY